MGGADVFVFWLNQVPTKWNCGCLRLSLGTQRFSFGVSGWYLLFWKIPCLHNLKTYIKRFASFFVGTPVVDLHDLSALRGVRSKRRIVVRDRSLA